MLETGVYFELMCVSRSGRSEGIIGISFSIFFKMKVYCVFILESPHRGGSNEYKQYTIFNTKKKITLNYLKSAAMGFFPSNSHGRVRKSLGKRAISIPVTEGGLCMK